MHDGEPSADERAILTPDQRLRVFISSTLTELAPERHAARDAVERLRLIPVMFEAGARPHPPRALYRAYLQQSHVFVGVYWQSYGWVAPEAQVSGIEDEYLASEGKPTLLYLKSPAPQREPRLDALLRRVEADGRASYRAFASAEELARLLADDLALLLTERFETARGRGPSPLGGRIRARSRGPPPRSSAATRRSRPSPRPCTARTCAWSPSRGRGASARRGWPWPPRAGPLPTSPTACSSSTWLRSTRRPTSPPRWPRRSA